MWQFTTGLMQSLLGAWLHTPGTSPFTGPLDAVYLGLCTAPTPMFQKTSVMSDVTEPLYSGYARQSVVWFATYVDLAGNWEADGQLLFFQPTGSTASPNVTGCFLASAAAAGTLLAGMLFAPNVYQLTSTSDGLPIVPTIILPNNLIYGGAQVPE